MNRAGCHSYFSPRLEIMTMIGQNLMVVNGLLEWKRKVGTKRSWLDIMSWLDMHWYRGGKSDENYLAMSLDTLVIILVHWVQKFWYWGGFVAIKKTFVLSVMSGHQLRITHHENGERNVCEPDHYADKSFLGTHYWDLCWKLANLTFKKSWKSNVQTWQTV